MWPYKTLHFKNNLFYNEKEERRGNTYFPFSPEGNTTEIFLLQKEIVIATLQRKNIHWEMKNFIDIINTSQKIKMRLEVSSVSLIFNTKINNQDILVINYEKNWKNETLEIDVHSLNIVQKIRQKIQCNLNEMRIDDKNTKYLHYIWNIQSTSNIVLDWYFILKEEKQEKNYFLWYKYPIEKIARFFYNSYQYNNLLSNHIGYIIIWVHFIIFINILFFILHPFLWVASIYSSILISWVFLDDKISNFKAEQYFITNKYLTFYSTYKKIEIELQLYKHTSQDEKLKKHIQNFLTYEKPYAITPEDKQKVILNNK